MGDQEPGDTSEKFRVGLSRDVVSVSIVDGIQLEIEKPIGLGGLVDVFFPSLEEEVGIVSEVGVLTGDAAIDLTPCLSRPPAGPMVFETRASGPPMEYLPVTRSPPA